MKRPRLPRLRRPTLRRLRSLKPSEDTVLAGGFFGGLALAAAAIALIYLPGGLLAAGVALATICGLLALKPKGDEE